ncbi:unnamed protein product [Rhizophagus irregularis]|nr:unnamed protein product [Rhizophagus irregularis]
MHNANVRRRASLSSAQVVTTNNPPRNTTSSSQPSKIPRPLSSSVTTASSRTASRTGIASKIPRGTPSPNRSRPTTPSVSRPTSRPVTPSFSQSAETINIFINYTEPDEQED